MKSGISSFTVFCLIVAALIWYPTVAESQVIKDGLAGYWSFDKQDVNDVSST